MRRSVAAGAAGLALVLLSACGAPASPATTASTSASRPATGAAAALVVVEGAAWEHVHNLALDGDALLLGTHQGLFRQELGRQPQLISDTPFDVMGLVRGGRRWLASGHPAAGEALPPDLGLRASDDGRTWTTVSLSGEVDFHRLTAASDTVMGIASHGAKLLRSTDGGASWVAIENPNAFDIAVDPGRPERVLATTQEGPRLSDDGGTSWRALSGAPLIAFAAWTSSWLLGVAPDGTVHVSTDAGATWKARGAVGGQPSALAVDGDRVVVAVGSSVVESTDGGMTFAPRLEGLGH